MLLVYKEIRCQSHKSFLSLHYHHWLFTSWIVEWTTCNEWLGLNEQHYTVNMPLFTLKQGYTKLSIPSFNWWSGLCFSSSDAYSLLVESPCKWQV